MMQGMATDTMIDTIADQVRAQILSELDAWRRVPWCVALAEATRFGYEHGRRGREGGTTVSFEGGPYGRQVNIDMTHFSYARCGLWLIPTGDITGPRTVIDCRDGQLLFMNDTVSPRTPLTNPEVVVLLGKAGCCLRPQPLLEREAAWCTTADTAFMLRALGERRITPTYFRRKEVLDAQNQTIVSLAGHWSGTILELLSAADLLLAA